MEPREVAAGNMFGREDAIRTLRCISTPAGCERLITQEEFDSWGPLTKREYTQSGWCKECQRKVFGTCPENFTTGKPCTHQGLEGEEECRCTCATPCCEADVGVGIITCKSSHCAIHGEDS